MQDWGDKERRVEEEVRGDPTPWRRRDRETFVSPQRLEEVRGRSIGLGLSRSLVTDVNGGVNVGSDSMSVNTNGSTSPLQFEKGTGGKRRHF